MNNKKMYLPCVIISILMVFSIIGLQFVTLLKCEVLSGKVFTKVIQNKDVASVVYTSLDEYFEEQYNSTGIPSEIYMQGITQNDVQNIIQNSVNNSLLYIKGESSSINIDYDFANLEKSLTQFFEDYATSIDYPKDETFYSQVNVTINNAVSTIKSKCDVFKISTINKTGIFEKVRNYYKYIDYAQYMLICLCIVLLVILIILNKKYLIDCIYWISNSLIISSVLALIPCVYAKYTNYFASFTIKESGVYDAITNTLITINNSYIISLLISLFLAIIGIISNLISYRKNI